MSRYIDAHKLQEENEKAEFYAYVPEICEAVKVMYGKNITKMHPADEFICSKCGVCFRDVSEYDSAEDVCKEFYFKYCPNCGAKMEKE